MKKKTKKFIKKLKFKEIKIPLYSYIFLVFGFCFLYLGLYLNHNVMISNEGKMPIDKNGIEDETHFIITNVNEVNYLFSIDMYHFNGKIYSIGDIFIYIGLFYIIISSYMNLHNFIIKRLLKN